MIMCYFHVFSLVQVPKASAVKYVPTLRLQKSYPPFIPLIHSNTLW